MTPTARKSRRSGFCRMKTHSAIGKNIFTGFFCEAQPKSFPRKIKLKSLTEPKTIPTRKKNLRERPPKTLPSFPEMPEK